MTASLSERRTALYRWYDSTGVLLYVGISVSPWARASGHVTTQDWAEQMAASTIEWHPDRISAEAAERTAIKAERPVYNKAHVPVKKPEPVQTEPQVSEGAPSLPPAEARRYYLQKAGLPDREVSLRQWYRWLNDGRVPTVTLLSGRRRVRTAELDALIRTGGVA